MSYINILNDDCIMRDEVELWGVVYLLLVVSSRNFLIIGIKIGFKMGVLGHESDNLHPSRVELIDKGLYLDAVTTINR